MENYIEQMIKDCNNRGYIRDEEEDFRTEFGRTDVYKLKSREGYKLIFWNSSNNSEPQFRTALSRIADELLDGNESGSVDDGWNEIMFEIKRG